MKQEKIRQLKGSIKTGNINALAVYIEDELLNESLRALKTSADYRYYQSRTVTLEEILKLLPKAQR